MAEIIGALRVVIGADTASLEKGLKSAQGSLSGFASASKVAVGVFAAVTGGLVVAMKGVINQADELGKLAQKIGIPVEELSKLKFAADLSGISLETFQQTMTRLSKNMNDVASKASGPAAAAFKALGIEVKNADGSLKSGSTIISEISGKFAGFRDGANKTALAVALFGRSGAEMIPMLNAGAGGLQRMKDEAARLGIVITEQTYRASEDFNDSITRLGAGLRGILVKVLAELAPHLRTLTDQFVILSSSGRNFGSVAEFIATVLKLLTSSVLTTVSGFIALGQVFGGFFAAAQRGWTDFAGRIADVKAGVESARGTLLNAGAALKAFWSAAAGSGMDQEFRLPAFFDTVKKDAPGFSSAVGGATNALKSFLDTTAKKTATLKAESETIGKSIAEQERLRIVYEGESIAKEKNIKITAALRQQLDQAAVSYGNLKQKVDEMTDRFNVVKSAMEGVAKKFEDALVGIADGTKTAKEAFADMTKAIISDLIRMMVQLQITLPLAQALTGAFGGSVSSLGLAGAGGFKMLGFAHGGSFTVPGSGGVDSRVAAFRVTPGERVTVQKPGSSDGNVFSPTYLIDARGADAAAVARIEQGLRERDRTFNDRVFSVQRKMSVRGGRP